MLFETSCRYAALIARFKWREETLSFPTACGPWTTNTAAGCNRVVLESSGCVGAVPDGSIVFENDVSTVNGIISSCVGANRPGKLQQPKHLNEETTAVDFIHITYNSDILGFIDDLYVSTSVYSQTETLVQLQS